TPARAWETRVRELEQNLRNPHVLLLRTGAFDPLTSEPATVRIGQTQLETTSLTARAARLTAKQAGANQPAYFIVQFPNRILPEQAESLRARGYELAGYVANNAYLIKAARNRTAQLQSAQASGEFRWVGA